MLNFEYIFPKDNRKETAVDVERIENCNYHDLLLVRILRLDDNFIFHQKKYTLNVETEVVNDAFSIIGIVEFHAATRRLIEHLENTNKLRNQIVRNQTNSLPEY